MSKQIDPEELLLRLAALPATTLAEALLSLSFQGGAAEVVVNRLTATSDELVKHINQRLTGIRRRRKFLFRSQAPELARELSDLLSDIEAAALPAAKGMVLVSKFAQLDDKVFQICDDSYGNVGDVFRSEVPPLFWHYATAVDDKTTVVELLVKVMVDDPWSTRMALLIEAPDFLPPAAIDLLADRLWRDAQEPTRPNQRRDERIWQVMALAKACHDPERYKNAALLHEKDDRNGDPKTSEGLMAHDAIEIARLYLASNQPEPALALVQEITAQGGTFHQSDCLELAQAAHTALGNSESAAKIARERYDASPSALALENLLAVVGEAEREAVVDETLATYTEAKTLDLMGLKFMLELGRPKLAATQVLRFHDKLDGEQYYFLPQVADDLIQTEEYLAASLILRALVATNLARANTKYYSHGVRYLVLAGRIAGAVRDWGDHDDHGTYFAQLQEMHKRKTSFWKKYLARKK